MHFIIHTSIFYDFVNSVLMNVMSLYFRYYLFLCIMWLWVKSASCFNNLNYTILMVLILGRHDDDLHRQAYQEE